jgi:acyl dehydratase
MNPFAPAIGLYRHRHTVLSMGTLAAAGLRANDQSPIPEDFASRSEVSGRVPMVHHALLKDFMRVTKAEPSHFRQTDGSMIVPPTFYVTWAMAALADAVVKLDLPYNYARVLHSASEVRFTRPLLVDEVSYFTTRVCAIDDNAFRAKIRVEGVVTERDSRGAEIFRNTMELHVPKPAKREKRSKQREASIIERTMRPLAELKMGKRLGTDYALVSGDFNPVHWAMPAALAMGFKSTFVQGYATKAMAAHAIVKQLLRGKATDLTSLRVEFRKPILLPSRVSVFVGEPHEQNGEQVRSLAVGKSLEGEAYVTGSFSYKS